MSSIPHQPADFPVDAAAAGSDARDAPHDAATRSAEPFASAQADGAAHRPPAVEPVAPSLSSSALAPFVSLDRDDFGFARSQAVNGSESNILDRNGKPVGVFSRQAAEAGAGLDTEPAAAAPAPKQQAPNPPRPARDAAKAPGKISRKIPAFVRRHGLEAATLAVALGCGWVMGANTFDNSSEVRRLAQQASALDAKLASLSVRPAPGASIAEIEALRRAIDTLQANAKIAKTADDAARVSTAANLSDLATRLDQVAGLQQDAAGRESKFTERMDRLEKEVTDDLPTGSITPVAAAPKTAPVTAAKVEPAPAPKVAPAAEPKIAAANPTASAPSPLPPVRAPDVSAPPPQGEAAPDETRASIPPGGYVLRDVIDGSALIESRAGLLTVKEGDWLPGVGRIESIERRGHKWIVVTSAGVIDDETY